MARTTEPLPAGSTKLRTPASRRHHPVIAHRVIEQAKAGLAILDHGKDNAKDCKPGGKVPGAVDRIDKHAASLPLEAVKNARVIGNSLLADDGCIRHEAATASYYGAFRGSVGYGHQVTRRGLRGDIAGRQPAKAQQNLGLCSGAYRVGQAIMFLVCQCHGQTSSFNGSK